MPSDGNGATLVTIRRWLDFGRLVYGPDAKAVDSLGARQGLRKGGLSLF